MIQGAKRLSVILENSSATELEIDSIPSSECGTASSVDCYLNLFFSFSFFFFLGPSTCLILHTHLGKSVTYGLFCNFKYYCLNVS